MPPKTPVLKILLIVFGSIIGFFCLIIIAVVISLSVPQNKSAAQISENQNPQSNTNIKLLPGIDKFLKENPQYGNVTEVFEKPDWDKGKRQQVNTNTGNYLFYMYQDDIASVYKYDITAEDGLMRIFHKEIPKPTIDTSEKEINKLQYRILFSFELSGKKGLYGEILVPNYSPKTPKETREKTLREICAKENFVSASMYKTEDAYHANISAKFLKQHPNALKNGFLGMIDEYGEFFDNND